MPDNTLPQANEFRPLPTDAPTPADIFGLADRALDDARDNCAAACLALVEAAASIIVTRHTADASKELAGMFAEYLTTTVASAIEHREATQQ